MRRWGIGFFKFERKRRLSECEFYAATLMLHLVENVLNPNSPAGRMANEVWFAGRLILAGSGPVTACCDWDPAGPVESQLELETKVTQPYVKSGIRWRRVGESRRQYGIYRAKGGAVGLVGGLEIR